MPSILDVFDGDGYQCAELTLAINKAPYVPSRLAPLFTHKGVTTTVVMLERNKGKIALLPTKTRGSGETTKRSATKRDLRPFAIPHIPHSDQLLADSIQGVRAFGSSDKLESINTKTNEILEDLRKNHELTHEYHRIGAIKGTVLDADGSTEIFDLFDEFDISQEVIGFELDEDLTKIRLKCQQVWEAIQGALGAVPFSGIVAQVGSGFWKSLMIHPVLEKAFERQQENNYARTLQRDQDQVQRLVYGDITFECYRGKVGNVPFIGSTNAHFYPVGVPDLFVHYSAPADYMETVNTIGQPVYAKQERMKYDKGVEFESQSNPAILCTRPETLIKGTTDLTEEVEETEDD